MKTLLLAALIWTGFNESALTHVSDTVIIRISDTEEIKIVSPGGNELEKLRQFDLNQIIRELYLQSEEQGEKTTIILQDSTGLRYLSEQEQEEEDMEEKSLEEKLETLERRIEDLNLTLEKEETHSTEQVTKFNKNESKGTSSNFTIELGFNNYMNDGAFPADANQLYEVSPFVSWYVALGGMNSTHIAGPLSLDWGANVSWYNFKFENERTRIIKNDGELLAFEDPRTDISAIKSKIALPYLNVTLVPMFVFDKRNSSNWEPFSYHENDGFRIGMGGYAGYRLGGRTKYVYRQDGDRVRDKNIENFYFNNFRYGVRLQMGFRGLDLFANYDLNEVFEENRGPRLNAFSFGIIL
ncbi:MAG: hypothetical protein ACLFUB_01105 [Cyclobacteriaceae bacterium]